MMERLVHINAYSKVFSVMELIAESKSVERLIDIRDGFMKMKYRYDDDNTQHHLTVKTVVFNPGLPFKK